MSYDDEAERTNYIVKYHSGLFSVFELRVEGAALARIKSAAYEIGSPVQRKLEEKCQIGDAEINAALAKGLQDFRMRAARRVLAEHPDLKINRCRQCNRILRTPKARQCLWCGYDWHSGNE